MKLGEESNLMRKYAIPNMRLGATSFLLHETYVPAVRFAAERCDDVALLLVEPGEHSEYLATPGEIAEIGRIIAGESATLHVHLPTDADFDTWEGARSMIGKIRRVAELTGPLAPHSFVLHVDFPSLHGTGGEPSAEQQEWTAEREAAQHVQGGDAFAGGDGIQLRRVHRGLRSGGRAMMNENPSRRGSGCL